MRIVLVGAVEGSAVAFNSLVEAGHPPSLLVTLPPQASNRHSDFVDLTSPARKLGIDVHQTININAEETIDAIRACEPDLTLVLGWSQICRQAFRDIASIGTLGFHPAALPRLRGRSVIPWTILRGEAFTGSTLFWLDDGVDSGDILLQRLFPLEPCETARSLYDKHTGNLNEMVPEAISLIRKGSPPRRPQEESLASYCAKRTPEDGLIDWHQRSVSILRLIRAVGDPYPGAFSRQEMETIRVDEAIAVPQPGRFIGIVGQVQAHTERGFIVQCADGECIEVVRWQNSSGRRPRLHSKFDGY